MQGIDVSMTQITSVSGNIVLMHGRVCSKHIFNSLRLWGKRYVCIMKQRRNSFLYSYFFSASLYRVARGSLSHFANLQRADWGADFDKIFRIYSQQSNLDLCDVSLG